MVTENCELYHFNIFHFSSYQCKEDPNTFKERPANVSVVLIQRVKMMIMKIVLLSHLISFNVIYQLYRSYYIMSPSMKAFLC